MDPCTQIHLDQRWPGILGQSANFTRSDIGWYYMFRDVRPDQIEYVRAKALGKEVVAHHRSDPAMIGGLKLRFGDRLVDGSITTRLRRLRDQLDEDGAARIRARVGEMIDAQAQAESD